MLAAAAFTLLVTAPATVLLIDPYVQWDSIAIVVVALVNAPAFYLTLFAFVRLSVALLRPRQSKHHVIKKE